MAAYAFINGNLTKDPVLSEYNGNKVCRFSIGTNTNKKGQDGKYASNFYNVTAWAKNAEYIAAHAVKGTNVNIIGEVYLDDYTGNDGTVHHSLACNASNVTVVARGKGTEGGAAQPAKAAAAPAAGMGDLPF